MRAALPGTTAPTSTLSRAACAADWAASLALSVAEATASFTWGQAASTAWVAEVTASSTIFPRFSNTGAASSRADVISW